MMDKKEKPNRLFETKPDGEFTADRARELLLKSQRENQDKCRKEMEEILKKYNCSLSCKTLLTDRINHLIEVVSTK